MAIGINMDGADTEYILLDNKEDIFRAFKKLSAKDKDWISRNIDIYYQEKSREIFRRQQKIVQNELKRRNRKDCIFR